MSSAHPHPDLPNPSKKVQQRQSDLHPELSVEQVDGQGIEGVDMSLKVITWEVGVPFHHIHNDGPPRCDVPLLRLFVQ